MAIQAIEYQNPQIPTVRTIHSTAALSSTYCDPSSEESIIPYANQNLGNADPTSIPSLVDGPTDTWAVALQAPVRSHIPLFLEPRVELKLQQNQENVNAGYAPLPGEVGPVNSAMPDEAQAIDMPIPERLRRLARRYVNDPESLVNGVRLEPGPFGRIQVVITIDITGIPGDTIN